MINFGDSQEQIQSVFQKAGIHDFKIVDFYYQPVGNSAKGLKKKGNEPVTYDKENLIVHVKCLKSYTDGKSEGSESHLRVNFSQKGDDKDRGRIDRLFHILANIGPAAGKEAFIGQLKKAAFKTQEEIATRLHKTLVGKNVRFKLTPGDDKKGAYLPGFFGGFAEPADVPFEKTALTWDEASEGNAKKDEAKTEKPGKEVHNPFGGGTGGNQATSQGQAVGEEEDLPF